MKVEQGDTIQVMSNRVGQPNQQGVVKNEVKVNVLNTPYGGFPWLDLPQVGSLESLADDLRIEQGEEGDRQHPSPAPPETTSAQFVVPTSQLLNR